jgi:hypothetical protein
MEIKVESIKYFKIVGNPKNFPEWVRGAYRYVVIPEGYWPYVAMPSKGFSKKDVWIVESQNKFGYFLTHNIDDLLSLPGVFFEETFSSNEEYTYDGFNFSNYLRSKRYYENFENKYKVEINEIKELNQ